MLSLSILGFAALAVSVAVVPRNRMGTALLLALGVALVVAFLAIERATDRQLFRVCGCFGEGVAARRLRPRPAQADLPDARTADGGHDGRHVCAVVRTATRRLYRRSRRASWGRAVGRLDGGEIGSASITSDRHIRRVVSVAPVVMAVGLLAAMLVQSEKSRPVPYSAGRPRWFSAEAV